MVLLRICPSCGWTPDRDSFEAQCLICGHSLEGKPQASPTRAERLANLLLHVLQKTA
jgi:hypothetical protein